jgi:hypothetical protein
MAVAMLSIATMPARGVRYVLSWDLGGVAQTEEGWSVQDGDVELVVTSLELVTYSVELMPCPSTPIATTRMRSRAMMGRVAEWLVPPASAGHSATRNDIATPFSVIERPMNGAPVILEPSSQTPGEWCRIHWLVARRDDDTVLGGPTLLPERHSLRITGIRRSPEGDAPFDLSTTLANGRYLDLSTPVHTDAGATVEIVRDAEALLRALGPELAPAAQERAVLRTLFETATTRPSAGAR